LEATREESVMIRGHGKNLAVLGAAFLMAALAFAGSASASQLVYSEDWSGGAGGWGGIGGFSGPQRLFIGHPLAQYVWYFGGGCGMGIKSDPIPATRMKLVTLVCMTGSNRNGFSVNVRDKGGGLIYKYSMGAGGRVDANCQPPTDNIRTTELTYLEGVPYELYSLWAPNTGRFMIGLKNMLTGEDRLSQGVYACRSGSIPGCITFDQEGGRGPAYLGRVQVWLGD